MGLSAENEWFSTVNSTSGRQDGPRSEWRASPLPFRLQLNRGFDGSRPTKSCGFLSPRNPHAFPLPLAPHYQAFDVVGPRFETVQGSCMPTPKKEDRDRKRKKKSVPVSMSEHHLEKDHLGEDIMDPLLTPHIARFRSERRR